MSRIRTPELDPASVFTDARDAAEIADEFREHLRRMHRAGRTTRAEHRTALTILCDLEVIVDGMAGHAGAILETGH